MAKEPSFSKSHHLEFSRLPTSLLDSTTQPFPVSTKVYLLFLHSCALSYHTSPSTYNPEKLLGICTKVEKILIPELRKAKEDSPTKLVMNISEEIIINNIYLAASIFSEVLSPFSGLPLDSHNLNRVQTVEVISYVCINLVMQRLRSMDVLDLNLISILNRINSLLHNASAILEGGSETGFLMELIQ